MPHYHWGLFNWVWEPMSCCVALWGGAVVLEAMVVNKFVRNLCNETKNGTEKNGGKTPERE